MLLCPQWRTPSCKIGVNPNATIHSPITKRYKIWLGLTPENLLSKPMADIVPISNILEDNTVIAEDV
jgi:hypothetical protein